MPLRSAGLLGSLRADDYIEIVIMILAVIVLISTYRQNARRKRWYGRK